MIDRINQKMFCFVLLLSIAISKALGNCPLYRGRKDGDILPPENCFTLVKDEYVYEPCTKYQTYCPAEFGKNVQCKLAEELRYPGVKCTSNAQCHSNECIKGVCKGKELNENCEAVRDCSLGFTCIQKKCVTPLPESSSCEFDTDCVRNCGCLDNKCTRYFSVPDKMKIKKYDASLIDDKGKRFCMKYFVHEGRCETFYNYYYNNATFITDSDDVPCYYINRYSEIFKVNNRECGLDGKAYCPLGNGDEGFQDYFSSARFLLLDNENCHFAERFKLKCQNDIFDKTTNQLHLQRVNRLLKEESIVRKHRFNITNVLMLMLLYDKDYDSRLKNFTIGCPAFRCVDKSENNNKCLQSNTSLLSNTTETTEYKVAVNLSTVCKENEYCSIGGNNPEFLMLGKDMTGRCSANPANNYPFRYPGENCTSNKDCLQFEGKPLLGQCDVDTKKCTGLKEKESCTQHSECTAGLFCNPQSKTCEDQKGFGEECTIGYECLNDFLCYNHTCQDVYYFLKENDTILIDTSDPIPWEMYCEFEFRYNDKCAQLKDMNNRTSKVPFIPTKESLCSYGTGFEGFKVNKKSKCGYNVDGYAYCPLAHDIDSDIWLKFFRAKARKYNNKCHTVNRFNCYSSNHYAITDIAFYSHYLTKGHLYYDAVMCAIDVLSSNWLSIRAAVLISFISFILL